MNLLAVPYLRRRERLSLFSSSGEFFHFGRLLFRQLVLFGEVVSRIFGLARASPFRSPRSCERGYGVAPVRERMRATSSSL